MICKSCNHEKDEDQFPVAGTVNGVTYRRRICNVCYVAQKRASRKKHVVLLEEYKKTCTCEHCGSTDYRTFEFHHRDPSEKDGEISKMVISRFAWKKILEEIKKCLCLCANCHRIVHYEERKLLAE